jgi:hypothetical protein
MTINLTHYAFAEGRLGYANGCATHQNPYYSEDGNVAPRNRKAFDQWEAGWKAREQEMCADAKAARQARMGYEY